MGAGVIGLTIAWRAASRGMSVGVVDPEPGLGASSAAAGMLAPVAEVHFGEEALLALNLKSALLYQDFIAELESATGIDVGYRTTPTLVVARDADDAAVLDRLHDFQVRLGLDAERLNARRCRAVEPLLSPSIRGGLLVRADNQVDNRALITALLRAAEGAGVEFARARASGVRVNHGRVEGVEFEDDSFMECDRVVVAAGAWSADLAGLKGLPIRPVKGQLLHLKGDPDQTPSVAIRGIDVYLVPRGDGRIVVGATVEEKGFDLSVTAGGVYELLHEAYALVPATVELELAEVAVGLRPGTPDNAPLLGPWGPEGLILATGHFRNGILLAPITGAAIVELLESGTVPDSIRPFLPARFKATESVA